MLDRKDLKAFKEIVDDGVDNFAVIVKKEFEKTNKEIEGIKANMVTKDYLDEKLSDLRGDLVVLTRKEDTKVKKLIDILKKRKLISEKDVNEVRGHAGLKIKHSVLASEEA